jgi:hypothetical protein
MAGPGILDDCIGSNVERQQLSHGTGTLHVCRNGQRRFCEVSVIIPIPQ